MPRRLIPFLLSLATILAAQSAPEVEITAEPHHHQIFANDQVRVFNVDVPPHTDTLMHWHRHDYVYVMLAPSQIVNAFKDKPAITMTLRAGDVALTPASFAHIVRNQDQPFRNITVELLQDEKLRDSTYQWDAERGLDILHGGTREIFFVKDNVRVSEFELQPGGMIPEHHHAGPHLVIALTDYELRSEIAGKPPTISTMKANQASWIPGGYTHTLTNSGHTPAKFITLEFP